MNINKVCNAKFQVFKHEIDINPEIVHCSLALDHSGNHFGNAIDKTAWYWSTPFSVPYKTNNEPLPAMPKIDFSDQNNKNSISDPVSKPSHYTKQNYFGKECIDIIAEIPNAYFGFCIGNAIKYLFRWDTKHPDNYPAQLQDLKKAKQYMLFIKEKVDKGIVDEEYRLSIRKIESGYLDTVLGLIQNEIELFEKYIHKIDKTEIESVKTIIKSTTNIIIKMLLTFYNNHSHSNLTKY